MGSLAKQLLAAALVANGNAEDTERAQRFGLAQPASELAALPQRAPQMLLRHRVVAMQ